MNVPLVLLNRRRRGSVGYNPAGLFALNEPGIWLDPSDVANLDWRRNLLTYTEQFDNAAWTKGGVSVTANNAAAPDGTLTADLLTGTGATPRVFQTVGTLISGLSYTASCYVKPGTTTSIGFDAINIQAGPVFTFATKTWSALSGQITAASFDELSDGWFRLRVTFTANVTNAGPGWYVSGLTTSLIWGAQLELGSVATDYQRISDVNTEVLERFPRTTMYQDRAGSTAVTTPGQSVGLRLDKSKGLVLGSELSAYPSGFSSLAGISGVGATVALSGTSLIATATSTDGSDRAEIPISGLTTGLRYLVTIVARRGAQGTNQSIRASTALDIPATYSVSATNQTFAFRVTAIAASGVIRVYAADATGAIGDSVIVDNISVKELPGNHAVANSDAARGIYGIEPLGGRRNLLDRTEEFDNAYWSKVAASIAPNNAVSPDGLTTADTLTADGTNTFHYLHQASSRTWTAVPHTLSIFMKQGTNRYGWVGSFDGTTNFGGVFDLQTGVYVGNRTGAGATSAAISSVGNGWYRCSITFTPAAAAASFSTQIGTNNSGTLALSDASSGNILIWGAQLEASATATAYQRVVDQYNVTEAGKQTLHYVQYDGSDDGYVTPTITPGTDKVQVFAGVRKLSDAAAGILLEHGTTSANNGTFYVTAPFNANPNYGFATRGTVAGSSTSYSSYAAPDTAVLTAQFDNAGTGVSDSSQIRARRNGVALTPGVSTTSAGNYLAYPLYIGRRAGTSLPFNGRDYGIITRFGANLDASTIAATESWLNQRTGAF